MKFKQIITSSTWPSVEAAFLDCYPQERKNMEGYEQVFQSLLLLGPSPSSIIILVKMVVDDFDGEEYVDVSGMDKNDLAGPSLAIEFTPWDEWLDMELDEKSLQDFSEPELIAHCLYEMTFMGFEQEEIKAQLDELNQQVEDLENMTKEEKERLISFDEWKKGLGGDETPEQ